MSTIIEMVPTPHATARTVMVGLEDDGIIITRVEDPVGTAVDKRFNGSSLGEGQVWVPTTDADPVIEFQSEKIGADARFVIRVKQYYDQTAVEPNIPEQRFLWYAYNDTPPYPDSTTPQTATPDTPLYIHWSGNGTPENPTPPYPKQQNPPKERTSINVSRLYGLLGTTSARREYLKAKLLAKADDPNLPHIMAGNTSANIVDSPANNDLARAQQTVSFRLEMLTKAISADINLDTEAKFNLLNGEIDIKTSDVFSKIDRDAGTAINLNGDRTTWSFVRLGSVSDDQTDPPYQYTAPLSNLATWTATADTTINVSTSVATNLNQGNLYWLTWLRQ